ncbi:hypothetical protein K443DRAFT_547182 [Laccaria amethystina LaAM-08-1]|jgi:hypothetical protein|uniref:Uncharacterized protein n=1 Tax=Laccaria amethystina LaAM-08-1 TaxID=1095629 RepID=A0A0C9XJW0_9AGAR|nr:hypothetical protein K443DRAFT_547182 [Laccaria amethystina LaAM-08-1]
MKPIYCQDLEVHGCMSTFSCHYPTLSSSFHHLLTPLSTTPVLFLPLLLLSSYITIHSHLLTRFLRCFRTILSLFNNEYAFHHQLPTSIIATNLPVPCHKLAAFMADRRQRLFAFLWARSTPSNRTLLSVFWNQEEANTKSALRNMG